MKKLPYFLAGVVALVMNVVLYGLLWFIVRAGLQRGLAHDVPHYANAINGLPFLILIPVFFSVYRLAQRSVSTSSFPPIRHVLYATLGVFGDYFFLAEEEQRVRDAKRYKPSNRFEKDVNPWLGLVLVVGAVIVAGYVVTAMFPNSFPQ